MVIFFVREQDRKRDFKENLISIRYIVSISANEKTMWKNSAPNSLEKLMTKEEIGRRSFNISIN